MNRALPQEVLDQIELEHQHFAAAPQAFFEVWKRGVEIADIEFPAVAPRGGARDADGGGDPGTGHADGQGYEGGQIFCGQIIREVPAQRAGQLVDVGMGEMQAAVNSTGASKCRIDAGDMVRRGDGDDAVQLGVAI